VCLPPPWPSPSGRGDVGKGVSRRRVGTTCPPGMIADAGGQGVPILPTTDLHKLSLPFKGRAGVGMGGGEHRIWLLFPEGFEKLRQHERGVALDSSA
jgi:hypothetical protein